MGVYLRGSVYWISYAGPTGKIERESTGQGDARVAAQMERDLRRQVARGTWKPARERAGELVTVDQFYARWIAGLEARGIRTVRSYRYRYRDHVAPALGRMALADLRPRHVIAFVEGLKAKMRAGEMAPRTVHHVYDVVRSLCRDAVIQEVIAATPCVLPPRTLPEKRDKNPAWRAGAVFTRDELEQLISDDRIPEDRRILYALALLGSMRKGEAIGRRWRDYDPDARPLGMLLIATQYENTPVKTERPREMPVHPVLAALLARWRLHGFPMRYGRAPRPEDFIAPHRDGPTKHRDPDTTWQRLQDDLERLGLRRRRFHDGRRTFVSIARIDGARPDILRTCTHGHRGSVFDEYTTWTWEARCAEVAKLRVGLRGAAPVGQVHNQVHTPAGGIGKIAAITSDLTMPGEGLEPGPARASAEDSRRSSIDQRSAASSKTRRK